MLANSYGIWGGTFRISQSNLFASPKTKIGPLKLLRNQSVELLSGTKTCAHLKGEGEKIETFLQFTFRVSVSRTHEPTSTSFSYWISSIALELPRSCMTDSACLRSSSRFIVLWKHKTREGITWLTAATELHHQQVAGYKIGIPMFQCGSLHLFPVETWCNSAVLRIWLVDLRVCVQQALHCSIAVKSSYIEQHLTSVKGEEEGAAKRKRMLYISGPQPFFLPQTGLMFDSILTQRSLRCNG